MLLSFIIVFIPLLVVFLTLHHLFPLVQIIGDSMYPTYEDKEIVLGTRAYRKSKLKIGDVIVYKVADRIVVKRIAEVKTERNILMIYCLGDNSEVSHDSRHYGYISSKHLICKLVKPRPNRRKRGVENG